MIRNENIIGSLLTCVAAVSVIAMLGCSQGTTRKDVANAHNKLQAEQQKTKETIQQGNQKVADAQQRANEHTVAKPVSPEQPNTQPTADQKKVADARENAAEKTVQQKEKEREAAGKVADTEQAYQNTQARDAYVHGVEAKLQTRISKSTI